MAEIVFTAAAIDDLRRIGPDAVPKVLKKVLLLATDPKAGYPLGGELTNYRKLVVGRNIWRIVYRITDNGIEVCEIWAIGARANAQVYAEAADRVRAAAFGNEPTLVRLAAVVERLGKLADIAVTQVPETVEPVPDWLADRLIYTAGLPREAVAAMNLREAVDNWTEFISKPSSCGSASVAV